MLDIYYNSRILNFIGVFQLSEISHEKMPGSESVRFGLVWMAPAVPVSRYCSLFLAHNRFNSQVNDVSAAKRGPRSRPFVPPRSPARLFPTQADATRTRRFLCVKPRAWYLCSTNPHTTPASASVFKRICESMSLRFPRVLSEGG